MKLPSCRPVVSGIAFSVLIGGALFASAINVRADEKPAGQSDKHASTHRIAWTTSKIVGSPDPPSPYQIEPAFPQLKFRDPTILTSVPGIDRLFLAENGGKILTFPVDRDCREADLAIDLRETIPDVRQVYGLTFHPEFKQNRYCYICYVLKSGIPDGTVVSRFTVTDADPPRIDPASEVQIITWLSGGHNGGCLKFGPDGYLYISTGDGDGPTPPDTLLTGQDISDLLSSVLRIDVDHPAEGQAYSVPADNPFVSHPGARPEVWSYGFRNPWKMSFDPATGDLWVGDVGWELWELVFRVERGGNYGWSTVEGRQPVNVTGPRGPTPILPPVVDHPHSEAASITGGYVYHGSRLPELQGAYIYGDYETGKIWALRMQGDEIASHEELVDTTIKLVAFGEDNGKELYLVDYGGTIHRLVPNLAKDTAGEFPQRLSETGLFTSVVEQTPAAGVLRYSINAEPWADGARAERFVALPGDTQIVANKAKWEYPVDTVFAKTLSLEMHQGDPQSLRRLETQILHYDGIAWQTFSYHWNDEQTDAVLAAAEGADRPFQIRDASADGGKRQQTWHFAARAECMRCHNPWSGPVLGFNALQLTQKEAESGEGTDDGHELHRLVAAGLFKDGMRAQSSAHLASPYDTTAPLAERARSYLHVNCAHCHRKNAGGSVLSEMQFEIALDKAQLIDAPPSQGTFGIPAARVVAAGAPTHSVLYYRMSKLGRGRMPHIGSNVVDRQGTNLIHDWIRSLNSSATNDDIAASLASTLAREADDEKSRNRLVKETLASTSGALGLLQVVEQGRTSTEVQQTIVRQALADTRVEIRELFERYVPEEQRAKRLGSVIRPEELLSLPGDAERGRKVFFNTAGVQCKNCHRLQEQGKAVGPDLTLIGRKLNKRQILESILEPSRTIDPKYVTYLAETSDGLVHTGVLVRKTPEQVVLKDVEGREILLPAGDVEALIAQPKSLMPELLLRDMTAREVVDLIEFLTALK